MKVLRQWEELSARMDEMEHVMASHLATLRLRKTELVQSDPAWLCQLRSQYTDEVSRRTLQANEEFPIANG